MLPAIVACQPVKVRRFIFLKGLKTSRHVWHHSLSLTNQNDLSRPEGASILFLGRKKPACFQTGFPTHPKGGEQSSSPHLKLLNNDRRGTRHVFWEVDHQRVASGSTCEAQIAFFSRIQNDIERKCRVRLRGCIE